jgi:predicted dehydrogenase
MPTHPTRREFLGTSAIATTAALAAIPHVHADIKDTLRIGLVGCGGRGTGAASQALRADPKVKLVAMADVFEDRLQKSLADLGKEKDIVAKIDVPQERCFLGFNAYQELLNSGVDVVLLCTPPHFRPLQLKAAVDAGKHIFAEKPVAVDAPGVRSVIATCQEAKKKNLSLVSGLCLRYHDGFRETVKRLHEGAIGEILFVQANDYRSSNWAKKRQPDWTDMQYQMRNWYNFTWLSGDFNVEQHVHFLDVCAWIMKNEYPVRAMGIGGRQVRTLPEHGQIYDHFSIVYEYENGARFISNTRQQPGCKNDMSAFALGSKGQATLNERAGGLTIRNPSNWVYEGSDRDMYQIEHDELFASIRSGKPINNGEYMAKSTLLAIMGRMAAYTGQQITWQMAMNSKEDLSPAKYDWNLRLPEPAVAMPGKTKFV